MFVGDSLGGSKEPLKVERTGGPDGYASGVNPGFGSDRDYGFDEVSSAETEVGLGGCQVSTRKAIGCETGSFVGTPSVGPDSKRWLVPALEAGDLPNTCSI